MQGSMHGNKSSTDEVKLALGRVAIAINKLVMKGTTTTNK